jgi:sorting nexin-25
MVYLRRLEAAKRMLDQKVMTLSTASNARSAQSNPNIPTQNSISRLESASLKEILYDASGLSYFMEFMDRQGLMRLVQFWIVVDGFRDPLEQVNEDADDHNDSSMKWTDADKVDIAQINDGYLSKKELKVPIEDREKVTAFLKAGKSATSYQYRRARSAILKSQIETYREMEETYFPKFKKSDLWYKLLASDDATIGPVSSETNDIDAEIPKAKPVFTNMTRSLSVQQNLHPPDLRRAVASASDLKGFVRTTEESPTRRSLDNSSNRKPLFDDEYESDPLANSTQSLESVDVETAKAVGDDPAVVDAMQEALNDIMGEEPEKDSLFSDIATRSPLDSDSVRGSTEIIRPDSPMPSSKEALKPSIASLGLVGAPSRRGVFNEDDLFGEEEKFQEDEIDEDNMPQKDEEDEIHEAAPGDLGLTEAIDSLSQEIEKLVTQNSILDSLTKKAELTNNTAELRILKKSRASLEREIRRKELQRQQYVIQESDNSLYGKATVTIKSIMVGQEEDGREFAMCEWSKSRAEFAYLFATQYRCH